MRTPGKHVGRVSGVDAPGPRARALLAAAVAWTAMAAAGCGGGDKPRTAMAICQELEAAGVAAGCLDTSQTACKYATERATFNMPGEGDKPGGQVLRFANEAQLDRMLPIVKVSKSSEVAESRSALMLIQLVKATPEAAVKAKAIVEKQPAVPAGQAAPDPTCAK